MGLGTGAEYKVIVVMSIVSNLPGKVDPGGGVILPEVPSPPAMRSSGGRSKEEEEEGVA